MALTTRRDAELLHRALDGEQLPAARADLADLAQLATSLPRPHPRPDPVFVARLRADLVVRAERRPARTARPRQGGPRWAVPRAIVPPRGRRWAGGLAAAALVLAVATGTLSTRSLPGDALYPVKLMLGQAQVRLGGQDVGRGSALLSQLDTRLDEVDALVAAGNARPALVVQALDSGAEDLIQAQRRLLASGPTGPDPEALRVLAESTAQASGRAQSLRPRVPATSVPALDRLLSLLVAGRTALLHQVARCGAPCADLRRVLAVEPSAAGSALRRLTQQTLRRRSSGAASAASRGSAGSSRAPGR